AEVTLKPAPAPTSSEGAQAAGSAVNHNTQMPIGVVLEIAGSGSQIALDLQRLNECMDDEDPSVGLAGQVGSQIKIRVGDIWLLASVRNHRKDHRANGGILANIDFLGEGVEEKLTGRLRGFRRGVTRYPIPGAMVYPANTTDLKQVYASDGRANVEIGTVYPTKDIRAGLYIDAMQQIMSNTSKILIDQKSGGNLLYLPLDKLMQMSGSAAAVPSAKPAETAPAEGGARGREAFRSRDREGR
ncbi:MAG: hypothetical protein ACO3HA_08055, partial [Burkholderiales bacterium]